MTPLRGKQYWQLVKLVVPMSHKPISPWSDVLKFIAPSSACQKGPQRMRIVAAGYSCLPRIEFEGDIRQRFCGVPATRDGSPIFQGPTQVIESLPLVLVGCFPENANTERQREAKQQR